jgi:hypothetical protein
MEVDGVGLGLMDSDGGGWRWMELMEVDGVDGG